MNTTTLYVAGKSGGHIIPAITLAQRDQIVHPHHHSIIITTQAPLDTKIITLHTTLFQQHVTIPFGTRSDYSAKGLVRMVSDFFISVYRTYYLVRELRPQKIISMGGAVSIPICFVGWILRIPYELYELNVVPGSAIKLLQYGAKKRYCCFPETQNILRKPVQLVDYPVRYSASHRIDRANARIHLNIGEGRRIIFIVGGSQGSQKLNRLIQEFVEGCSIRELYNLFIIHQTGQLDEAEVGLFYKQFNVQAIVFSYRDDMALLYNAADIVVTRAGSGILHEINFFELPALIIPLEIGTNNHQVANANAYQKMHITRAWVFREQDLGTPQQFKKFSQLIKG